MRRFATPVLSQGVARALARWLPRRGYPFVPLAPFVVVILGVAVALGVAEVGREQRARAREERAAMRAELLATTLAVRLGSLRGDHALEVLERAAHKLDASCLVVALSGSSSDPEVRVLYDAALHRPTPVELASMLRVRDRDRARDRHGVMSLATGRTWFAVAPLEPLDAAQSAAMSVVVLVQERREGEGPRALAPALLAFVTLLLGVAVSVAYAVSRDVIRDVDFITARVTEMAHVGEALAGEPIPVRTIDSVGRLTHAFNRLIARFDRAEKDYRRDLARAYAGDRERAAFLAAVSHELRNPLNAILGFSDILMDEVDGPLCPSAREEVEQIRGSGAHLLSLINDILEFSALETGQLRLSKKRVDLRALAVEVVREARGVLGDKALTVRVEGAAEVMARVDARRIRQVLVNLVDNAIKFTLHGEVVVHVAEHGNHAVLRVIDTGLGIADDERNLIFQPFQQAQRERAKRRGTGLGLAIARRLVTLHQGSIDVLSSAGKGSTFEVRLPLGDPEKTPFASTSSRQALRRPWR